MPVSSLSVLIPLCLLSVLSAIAGVWLTNVPEFSRRVVPFSGAVLVLMSLFWVLPELSGEFGWSAGLGLMLIGFAALWAVDRFVHPVCPACSHTHNHDTCITRLHGFATPLILAASLHTMFDGWALAAAHDDAAANIGRAVSLGVAFHKIPEGLAFGVLLRAALRSRSEALSWAVLVQTLMLAGGFFEALTAPYLGHRWMAVLLALGGGTFLYLGFHAVHSEWKRRTAHHKQLAS